MSDIVKKAVRSTITYAPVILALVGLVYVYWWLLSQATWNLIGYGWRGDSYDSLAASLLEGRADVDPQKIQIEVFNINGRSFMYFGPFPAILRLPFVAKASAWVGALSPLSCFVASMLSVLSVFVLCAYHARRYPLFAAILLVGFGLGTPALFLAVSTSIYHEAIMWGLAGAMCSVVSLIMIWYGVGRPYIWLCLCACGAAVALLSRITFGMPAYLAVFVSIVTIIRARKFSLYKTVIACVPVVAAVLAQMWYNQARFGSPFIAAALSSGSYYLDTSLMGGWFNPARIPDMLRIYFAPGSQFFLSELPFVQMQRANFSNPAIFFTWKEPIAPLTITSAWLVALAVVGILVAIRARSLYTVVTIVAFMATWLPILSFYNVTGRFTAEFLPVLVFLMAYGMTGDSPWMGSLKARVLSAILIVWSIGCTVLSTIGWPSMVSGVPLVSERLNLIFSGNLPLW